MKWRLNTHTHEIVEPTGVVVARLRISQNGQMALDSGKGAKIDHSGGSAAFGYHTLYCIMGRGTFPADDIGCELNYFTGNDFAGCTVKPKGEPK